jgi:hypothetical protein
MLSGELFAQILSVASSNSATAELLARTTFDVATVAELIQLFYAFQANAAAAGELLSTRNADVATAAERFRLAVTLAIAIARDE